MNNISLHLTSKKEDINQTKSDLNSIVNDDVTEIHDNTQDSTDINLLICAPDCDSIDQRICAREIPIDQDESSSGLYNEASRLNDEANGTPTSSINTLQCVKIQPSENCHLSEDIYKLFPGRSEKEVVDILKKVQDEIDKIWAETDKKYEKNVMSKELSIRVCREFKTALKSYLYKEFPTQVELINVARSILDQSSFGILLCNSKNEVLGVQNHFGTWSAMKGHRRIRDDGTLETPWEASIRELFEELSIRLKRSKRDTTITEENIQLLGLNKTNFLQCHVDTRPNTNDKSRLIGLFYACIDEKKFKFSLKDNKENIDCKWLNINDILKNKPEGGRDIYHTLRPFVQYLKDYPIY